MTIVHESIVVFCVLMWPQGLVYFKYGRRAMDSINPVFGCMSVMGSLFFTVLALQIMPFVSISLFIYDRQFYIREAASEMYFSR